MKRDYQIWNVLHDGALVDIEGNAPGDIRIKVKIEYIANKLNGQYDHIIVNLKNCSLFEYERQWSKDNVQVYKTIKELEGISPTLIPYSGNKTKRTMIANAYQSAFCDYNVARSLILQRSSNM